MDENQKRDIIVRAIIGDMPVALSSADWDDDNFEDITDEEIAEFEALPDYEMTPEERARFIAAGMKIVRWCLYAEEMRRRGLPYLDRHEYMNMEIEPQPPPA